MIKDYIDIGSKYDPRNLQKSLEQASEKMNPYSMEDQMAFMNLFNRWGNAISLESDLIGASSTIKKNIISQI